MKKLMLITITLLSLTSPYFFAMHSPFTTERALEIILENTTIIDTHRGKAPKNVHIRNTARRKINLALAALKLQAIPIALLENLAITSNKLAAAAASTTQQTHYFIKKITEDVALIAKTKIDTLEQQEQQAEQAADKKIAAVQLMVKNKTIEPEKGATLVAMLNQKKAALAQKEAEQTAGLTGMITNLVGPLVTGSYAYTTEELAAMNNEINEIEQELIDLQAVLTDTEEPLNVSDKVAVKAYMHQRARELNRLLEKTGKKLSTAQKGAAAAAGIAALYGAYKLYTRKP